MSAASPPRFPAARYSTSAPGELRKCLGRAHAGPAAFDTPIFAVLLWGSCLDTSMADEKRPTAPGGGDNSTGDTPESDAPGSKSEPGGQTKGPAPGKPAPKAAGAVKRPAAARKPAAKKPAVMETTPWEDDLTRQLREQFGDRIIEFCSYRDQKFLVAKPDAVVPILEFLKLEADFDYLVDVTAVDYPKKEERFELVYIVYSFARNERIRIKTRMLLPRDEGDAAESDPREELIMALIEYKKYKEAGEVLREKALLEERHLVPPSPVNGTRAVVDLLPDTSLFDLLTAFRDVLASRRDESFHQVTAEEVSIVDRMHYIMSRLEQQECSSFRDLFADAPVKIVAVMTFIALLELVRTRRVVLRQSRPFAELRVYRGELFSVGPTDFESAADRQREEEVTV